MVVLVWSEEVERGEMASRMAKVFSSIFLDKQLFILLKIRTERDIYRRVEEDETGQDNARVTSKLLITIATNSFCKLFSSKITKF